MLIARDSQDEHRTYGVLTDGDFTCQTLELPWKDDATDESCIRAGEYTLELTWSPHFGYALYLVVGDPARVGVRIHAANIPAQLEGCIALGKVRASAMVIAPHVPADGIAGSRPTLDAFMAHCGIPNYRDLTTAEAVHGFLTAHPEAASFPLTIADPSVP